VRRPARANSVASGPARAIPDHLFKCTRCGKTLPVAAMEPNLPAAWQSCRACVVRERLGRNGWNSPLGTGDVEVKP
jgi:hypothetical protein